jgi:hypothetical protein
MAKVTIDATREDAEAIEDAAGNDLTTCDALDRCQRIAAAIRQQIPEPLTIPENLGAVVESQSGDVFVCIARGRGGRCHWVNIDGDGDIALLPSDVMKINAARVLSEGVKP